MEDKCIYVITTFEHLPWGPDKSLGCSRTPGYYFTFEAAEDAVKNNKCDIWERCYDYACITKVFPGFYTYTLEDSYYRFNIITEKYEPIETPDELKRSIICEIG